MIRPMLMIATAVAGLAIASHGAQAFTVINQQNFASGGARAMAVDPDAQYGKAAGQQQGLSFGGDLSSQNAPGYGGFGTFDMSNGSTSHDNFPSFPGQDNHLNAGSNAGMLQYGAIPGRKY